MFMVEDRKVKITVLRHTWRVTLGPKPHIFTKVNKHSFSGANLHIFLKFLKRCSLGQVEASVIKGKQQAFEDISQRVVERMGCDV